TNTSAITLEITNTTAASVISADPGVTVVQTTPTIKLSVNVAGAGGQTFHARFFGQILTLTNVADAYVENGTNANANFGLTNRMLVKTDSNTNITREAHLRFQ